MTLDEADTIIAELNICFPSRHLLVEEVKRWENNLCEFHFEDAKRAVKKIEDTLKFWPSWSEFRDAILPLHKNRIYEENERKQMEIRALQRPASLEEQENIAEIIKQIKNNLLKRA